jgi:hypothetical protein
VHDDAVRGPYTLTGSAGHDLLMAATGGAAGALGKVLVDQVTQHLTNRPPKEELPKIELPPGVERKWAKALPGGQS